MGSTLSTWAHTRFTSPSYRVSWPMRVGDTSRDHMHRGIDSIVVSLTSSHREVGRASQRGISDHLYLCMLPCLTEAAASHLILHGNRAYNYA